MKLQSHFQESGQGAPIKGRKINYDQVDLNVPPIIQAPPKRPRKTNYSLNFESHIPSQNQQVYLDAIISQNQESQDKFDMQQTISGRESELYPKGIYKNQSLTQTKQGGSQTRDPHLHYSMNLSKEKLQNQNQKQVKNKKKRKKTSKTKHPTQSQSKFFDVNKSNKGLLSKKISSENSKIFHQQHSLQANNDAALHSSMFNREAAIRKSQQIYSTFNDNENYKSFERSKNSKSKSKSNSKSQSQQKSKALDTEFKKIKRKQLNQGARSVSAERAKRITKTDQNELTQSYNRPSQKPNDFIYKSPQVLPKSRVQSNQKGSTGQKNIELSTFFNEKKSQIPPPVSLVSRRKELGLEFLNSLQDKKIDKLLERNRLNSLLQEDVNQSDRKRPVFTPKQLNELQRYIKEKKKFYHQFEQLRQVRTIVKKQHIHSNLDKLGQDVKKLSASNSKSPKKSSNQQSTTLKESQNQRLKNLQATEQTRDPQGTFQSRQSQNVHQNSKEIMQEQYNELSKRFKVMQKKLNYQLTAEQQQIVIEKAASPSLAHLISQSSSNNLLSMKDSYKNSDRNEIQLKHKQQIDDNNQNSRGNVLLLAHEFQIASQPISTPPDDANLVPKAYDSSQPSHDGRLNYTNQQQSLSSSIQCIEEAMSEKEHFFRLKTSMDDLEQQKGRSIEVKQQLDLIESPKKAKSSKSSTSDIRPLLSEKVHQMTNYSNTLQPYIPQKYEDKSLIKQYPPHLPPQQQFPQQFMPQQQFQSQSQPPFEEKKNQPIDQDVVRPENSYDSENASKKSSYYRIHKLDGTVDINSVEQFKSISDDSRNSSKQPSFDSKSGKLKIPKQGDYTIMNEAWPIFADKVQAMTLQGRLSPQNVIRLNELNYKRAHTAASVVIDEESNIHDQQKVTEGSMYCQPSFQDNFNSTSNKDNQSFNSFIQCIEEQPLDLEHNQRSVQEESKSNVLVINELITFDDETVDVRSDQPMLGVEVAVQEPNIQVVCTNIRSVKIYMQDIMQTIDELFESKFLQLINSPIGPSAFEILKFFRFTDDMVLDDGTIEGGFQHQAVLGLECFAMRERKLEELHRDQPKVLTEFIVELERIHNKAIFDAFNEALDYYRPFGIKGRPLPWKKCNKQSYKLIERHQSKVILELAQKKVLGWTESMCGILLPNLSITQSQQLFGFDSDILPQIREERLDKMLSLEIRETDDRWQEFEEEQTEVGLELSEVVFELLISECSEELQQLGLRKQQKGIRMLQKQDLSFLQQDLTQQMLNKNPYI